jgi:branched-chain amino acid transport system substrate-binding protein
MKQRNGKFILVTISIISIMMILFACGEQQPAQQQEQAAAPAPEPVEPIRIGVAGPHSGDLASYGIPTIKAAELVVEHRNSVDGINGRKIELVVEDDECKPEKATNTATKLVGDKVNVVLGHICSGATKSALGIYRDSNLVAISPSATNPP